MGQDSSINQLKFFLKEMFQFNANDLDFGIYRIYNLKRKEIENFIDGNDEQCLEPIINETLKQVKNIEKRNELESLKIYLKKEFGKESLAEDPITNSADIQLLISFSKNEEEKESLTAALVASTKELNITDEIKDKIYNHILGYFEMYYSNGEFGYNNRSRNLYKVPYEADYDGTDTMFHWKHKGSIYIKTGNSFNAIKFKLRHLDKEFELRLETNEESKDEEVARNNNKDTKLKHYKFNRFEEKDGVTRIVFNLSDASTTKATFFKALFKEVFKSEEDLDNYLFAPNDKGELKPVFNDLTDDYDKVQEGSVKGIGALRVNRDILLKKVNKNFERGNKIEIITQNGQECFSDKTLETLYNVDQKLNSFYIGNDSDYFVHENLQEFLTGEKERYIKNHILSDLKSILDGKLDNTTIIIAKAFDLVTSRIIEFLSAIEDFQKKLFTMKKKVVESEYCLTIDNIEEKYYPEILENKAQLEEWENLFSEKVKTLADLKAQPTLVLDTKFFKQKDGSNLFKDKILSEIENLDERTNGLLINSENYQALTFLLDKYTGKIQATYIDPPYNTTATPIIYKNHFKDSSWLTLVLNRIQIGKKLMHPDGMQVCTIDDVEHNNLGQLLKNLFGEITGTIAIRIKPSGRPIPSGFALSHEYALFTRTRKETTVERLERDAKQLARYKEEDEKGKFFWEMLRKAGSNSRQIDRPTMYFPIYYNEVKNSFRIPKMDFDKNKQRYIIKEDIELGEISIYPTRDDGSEGCWYLGLKRLEQRLTDLKAEVQSNEAYYVYYKRRPNKGVQPLTTWIDSKYSATEHGTALLKKLFGEREVFSYPKSIHAVVDCLKVTGIEDDAIAIDYFAGSGTTGHAIINMNNEDDGSRKYILVEMGMYFSTVTKPRIQKVIYSHNWKDGKPVDTDGSNNHIFKYIILEQYEDVLDAIEQFEGEIPNNLALKYLYKPELNKINSTLDLSKPFSNKIRYGQPTKEGFVDLIDTYNYFQGYEINSIKTYIIGEKYYKVVETADTIVVWRDIELGQDDSKAINEIAEKYPEATQVEVNYDFNILATLKDKQLQVGTKVLQLNIIHADAFNQ